MCNFYSITDTKLKNPVNRASFKTQGKIFGILCLYHTYHTTNVETTSGLAAAVLKFRCLSISAGVGDKSIGTADPEILGEAVEILFLTIIEQK